MVRSLWEEKCVIEPYESLLKAQTLLVFSQSNILEQWKKSEKQSDWELKAAGVACGLADGIRGCRPQSGQGSSLPRLSGIQGKRLWAPPLTLLHFLWVCFLSKLWTPSLGELRKICILVLFPNQHRAEEVLLRPSNGCPHTFWWQPWN